VYLANNAAYTLLLKRYPFVDVMSIAGGFLLRVVAGAVVLSVEVSPWLLVCTGLLALLLGFGKRAHELTQTSEGANAPSSTRRALAGYRRGPLTAILLLLAAATCAAYALYTRDDRTIAYFGTGQLVWTLPFPLVGIARFLDLSLWRPRAESPTDAILRDWVTGLVVAGWAAAVLSIIYGTVIHGSVAP
jgi:4-hydroxybenzoate polyprenyltransferase